MTYTETEIKYYVDIITKLAGSPSGETAIPTDVSKSKLLTIYHDLKTRKLINLTKEQEQILLNKLKKKYIRSLSGVTTVTVLTMPYPCPGKCIFCPNDVRMPKSYIASEPGAQRALANKFDPYLQTFNRLVALNNNGHPLDKIEMIVLGGTWTFYPENYRRWFIYRVFQALNDFNPKTHFSSLNSDQIPLPINLPTAENSFNSTTETYNHVIAKNITMPDWPCSWEELNKEFEKNENSHARCVGLSLETRPDEITEDTVLELRRLGATKVQMGVQALDNNILNLNKRGHSVETTIKAFELLRLAGFKIQVHWMPNLYGSNPQKDLEMFFDLFQNEAFKPDELKIYPCSLIPGTELVKLHNEQKWHPYDHETLLKLVIDYLKNTPRYCRVTRVIRDIPSTEIAAGSTRTNLRQDAELAITKANTKVVEIRFREIKKEQIDPDTLQLKKTVYETSVSSEYFLEYITPEDKLTGFLRLSLPKINSQIPELQQSAVIREIHVYGQSLKLGTSTSGVAQHSGLGKKLILLAEEISQQQGYTKLSVISAIGTREYYRKRGFKDGNLYQYKFLS